jgi:hypothetical protein
VVVSLAAWSSGIVSASKHMGREIESGQGPMLHMIPNISAEKFGENIGVFCPNYC